MTKKKKRSNLKMIIRKATSNDIGKIANNNAQMALDSENKIIDHKTTYLGVKSIIDDPKKGFYLIAEENKEIIGQLMITFEWSDWNNFNTWWIQSLYVQKDQRKRGVFKNLFEKIIKEAKYKNIGTLKLYVHSKNLPAIQVYKKIGMNKKDYQFFQFDIKEKNSS